ncbi:MAG: MetQ/NlpA family ABC transporter substrate-binding protein, partial [Succinivibrio sp.]
MKKLLSISAAAFLAAASFSASANETVTVAATPVPHVEILETVKPVLEKQGITLKIIEFNDYIQPNLTVADGQIDANYFQHRPYLNTFVKDRGSDLVEVAGIHVEPIGAYSNKVKDLKDLKKGASVGIPNDP